MSDRAQLSKQRKEQRLLQARKELEEKQMAECTFKPQITSKATELQQTRVPFVQRLSSGTPRTKPVYASERDIQEELECTFTPVINANSARLAQSRGVPPRPVPVETPSFKPKTNPITSEFPLAAAYCARPAFERLSQPLAAATTRRASISSAPVTSRSHSQRRRSTSIAPPVSSSDDALSHNLSNFPQLGSHMDSSIHYQPSGNDSFAAHALGSYYAPVNLSTQPIDASAIDFGEEIDGDDELDQLQKQQLLLRQLELQLLGQLHGNDTTQHQFEPADLNQRPSVSEFVERQQRKLQEREKKIAAMKFV